MKVGCNGEGDVQYMSLGKALEDELVKVKCGPQRRNYGIEIANAKNVGGRSSLK